MRPPRLLFCATEHCGRKSSFQNRGKKCEFSCFGCSWQRIRSFFYIPALQIDSPRASSELKAVESSRLLAGKIKNIRKNCLELFSNGRREKIVFVLLTAWIKERRKMRKIDGGLFCFKQFFRDLTRLWLTRSSESFLYCVCENSQRESRKHGNYVWLSFHLSWAFSL